MRRSIARLIIVLAVIAPMLLLGLALGVRTVFIASLARLDGSVPAAGISRRVTIERDALGVARVRAASYLDACVAEGFLHAQDRFFQMDGMRRFASGRIGELVGARALPTDERMRTLGLARVADAILERLPERHLAMLDAYTEGVNAGLADLGSRPPEYWALSARPEAWTRRDCILVAMTMAWGLEFGFRMEETRAVMHGALPEDLAAFLTPEFGAFDAPLDGSPAIKPGPIPAGPGGESDGPTPAGVGVVPPRGSNGFVVAGARTESGGAMLASDMHLGLGVPNTWYRVQIECADWPAGRRLIGVSLPGVPGIAVGSNGEVAWGFTNTTGDNSDDILLQLDPEDPSLYRTPDGWERIGVREESIGVKGAPAKVIGVRTTRWGPIVGTDPATKRPRVLRWIMLDPERFNLDLFDMASVRSAREGVETARHWFGPSQNAMIADRYGSIGWTVTGAIPKRIGFDGSLPSDWSDGARAWDGVIADADRPFVIDPADGFLATANNRTLAPPRSRLLGTHWANGSRAGRIAELLRGRTNLTEADLLAVQLDTRSPVMAAYARHLRGLIPALAPRIPAGWDGRADIDSETFTLVESWARAMQRRVMAPVVERCRAIDPSFNYSWMMDDEAMLSILDERPASWLPAGFASWEALALDAAGMNGGAAPPRERWGDANRANIRHQFSSMVPAWGERLLERWGVGLDMPRDPLPGHPLTVRVQSRGGSGGGFGASERLVVTPGREERGIYHMPGGQSGHFLSRYYRAGHEDWVRGRPTPLLAGEAEHTLTLIPR